MTNKFQFKILCVSVLCVCVCVDFMSAHVCMYATSKQACKQN